MYLSYMSCITIQYLTSTYLSTTTDTWQSNTLILSTKVDQKWLETEFSIGICGPIGNKLQSKTLF